MMILIALRAVWPSTMPEATPLIAETRTYIADQYALVGRAALALLLLSCALAVLGYYVFVARTSESRSLPHDAQWVAFHADRPTSAVPYIEVWLDDGSAVRGRLLAQDTIRPRADRQLAIAHPFRIERPGAEPTLSHPWERLVVAVTACNVVKIMFAGEGSGDPVIEGEASAAATEAPISRNEPS